MCSSTSATGCDTGQAPGDTFVNNGGQCFECVENPKPKDECHCSSHRIDCPTQPECTDGDTRYCDTGLQGVCQEGTETCVDGQWSGTCAQDVPSGPEVCDGLDNDCDGTTDEDGVCDECTSGENRHCDTGLQGVCQEGTETCVDGQWSGTCAQDVPSGPEVCDGLDNDCDGATDEDGVCDECTSGETRHCDTGLQGVCQEGTETCVNGQWSGTCAQDVPSGPEVCDGLDNDCDGATDEGGVCDECTSGENRHCDTGLQGVCQEGTETCVDGQWSGTCAQDVPSQPEVCDGLDNDCDGATDEGGVCDECTSGENRHCDTGLQGICQEGTETCVDGQWSGTCAQDVPSQPEVCDGLDNDCDGKVDEGCECIPGDTQSCYTGPRGTKRVGICKAGTQTCDVSGQWSECVGAVVPAIEVCDGLDNDCDSSVDEGLGTVTCGIGECKVTVDTCVGGEEQKCVPGQPANEICDGLDNDCDGKVDERRVCGEDEEEPTPPPPGPAPPPPAPTPTPMVEVLGVEILPVTGEMPVAPTLPMLPMMVSSLTLVGAGLLLRRTDQN